MNYLFQGLMLGFSYVAPIGIQNLYVINGALSGDKKTAYKTAFITIFFDISLALACFFGIGLLLKKIPIIEGLFLLFGCIMVVYIGISLIKSSPEIEKSVYTEKPTSKIIRDCFAVTWLNPQALVDGSLLLGGYQAYIPKGMSIYFILGFCSASFLWFTTLSTIVSIFHTKINNKMIKWINVICGIIIIIFGARLGISFFKKIL